MDNRPPVRRSQPNGAQRQTSRSASESAARRRALERYRKNQRRKNARYALFFASRVLLFYVIFCLVAALIFLLKINSFPKSAAEPHDVFIVSLVQDEYSDKKKGTLLKKDSVTVNGVEYIPVSVLSEYAVIAEGGDLKTRTLYIGSEYACFFVGTGNVEINGEHTTLGKPSLIRDGELCVPAEFYDRCLLGVKAQIDAATDRLTLTKTGELSFALKEQTGDESISYEELALRIRLERETLNGAAQ